MSKINYSLADDPADDLGAGDTGSPSASAAKAPASLAMRTAHELHKDDRHFVTALARGLDVLACFRSGDS